MKRVAHGALQGGGDHMAALRACRDAGVQMVELDVLARPGASALMVAHDYEELKTSDLTFERALDLVSAVSGVEFEFNVDLKTTGYEREVVDAMGERGLLDRAVFSSHHLESLEIVGQRAPGARRGISVPNVRRDYTQNPLLAVPALAAIQAMKALLPARVSRLIGEGRCDAVMAFRMLVSPRLVEATHAAGGQVYVWTVDDAREIEKLTAMGVDAVITNDPRLFHPSR